MRISQLKLFITWAAGICGGVAFGMLIAVCFLFENDEIAANTKRFWEALLP